MTSIFRTPQIKISTGTTDNDTVTTKGYVDEHEGNGIWTKTGTEVNLTIVTNTIGATNPLTYTTHPTFTIDEEIVDKKYVDDQIISVAGLEHETLIIASPGQTAFTLAQAPVSANKSILTLNGQIRTYGSPNDYTISGTTLTWNDPLGLTLKTADDFQLWYDLNIAPPGSLDQIKMYYVADAGDDTNNGKSVERPFKTLAAAVAAVNTQSPALGNEFAIQMIGGMHQTVGIITLSPFTTLIGDGNTTITGTINLDTDSNIDNVRIIGQVLKQSIGSSFLKSPIVANPTGNAILVRDGGLYAHVDAISGAGDASVVGNNGGTLYLECNVLEGHATSAMIVGDFAYRSYYNIGRLRSLSVGVPAIAIAGGHTITGTFQELMGSSSSTPAIDINTNGILRANTNYLLGTISQDGSETLELLNAGLVAFIAYRSGGTSPVTGDGTIYSFISNPAPILNTNNVFNNTTGEFTAPAKGLYHFEAAARFLGLQPVQTTSHGWIEITGIEARPYELWDQNPYDTASGISPNPVGFSGGAYVLMDIGDTARFQFNVSGGTKTVTVNPTSSFSGKLIRNL